MACEGGTLQHFAEVCEQIAATASRSEKQRLTAEYLPELSDADLHRACTFLAGRAVPVGDPAVLGVGGATLAKVLRELAAGDDFFAPHRRKPVKLGEAYRRFGDLGDAAAFLLREDRTSRSVSLADVDRCFRDVADVSGTRAKARKLFALLDRCSAPEVKYVLKILTGDLRIGAKEGLLEAAVAEAFDQPLGDVRRANLYLGDLGDVADRARHGRLGDVAFRLIHPIRFMLAAPIGKAEELAGRGIERWMVEDKYDGIRAQVHKQGDTVSIFGRTQEDIRERFPELVEPILALRGSFLLDGEIVAGTRERLLGFGILQRRLGRRRVGAAVQKDFPCCYIAFDLLYHDAEALFDTPLAERRTRLESVAAGSGIHLSTLQWAGEVAEIEALFAAARQRGSEGIVAKDPQSRYTPGRRGKAWRKLKRPMETLDCVVVAAEYGHGKRHGVLSDYTFAVRDGDRLVTIAKAYSGLTDPEIHELTRRFRELTVAQQGSVHQVQPVVVMEVAFDQINRSDRHTSGFALRFPRIVRIREDKGPGEIDTLRRVEEFYREKGRS